MTLKEASDLLHSSGIADPLFEARLIFEELGGFKKYELLSPSVSTDEKSVEDAVYRRAKREPLQYVLGVAYFYREVYKVTPDVLIPREDTEILVDYAVKHLREGDLFFDLCTGSGCIALSVLNNTKDTRALMVDISEGAIRVAEENAASLGLSERVSLLIADATLPLSGPGSPRAILSNPPYVTSKAYGELEKEIYFEPKGAFVGGEDGGDFYRKITPIYRDIIPNDGFIAYEIGYDQAELLKAIASECSMRCEIIKDLSGNDRVAVLTK